MRVNNKRTCNATTSNTIIVIGDKAVTAATEEVEVEEEGVSPGPDVGPVPDASPGAGAVVATSLAVGRGLAVNRIG